MPVRTHPNIEVGGSGAMTITVMLSSSGARLFPSTVAMVVCDRYDDEDDDYNNLRVRCDRKTTTFKDLCVGGQQFACEV